MKAFTNDAPKAGGHTEHMASSSTGSPLVGLLKTRFRDIDELAAISGWDVDFRQLDSGCPDIPARLLSGQHINILGAQFNRGFHQRGEAPQGSVTFALPLTGLIDWYGRSVEAPGIVSFNGPAGFDGVSRSGFEVITISIEQRFFERASDVLRLPIPEDFMHQPDRAFLKTTNPVRALRSALLRCLEGANRLESEWRELALVGDLLNALCADGSLEYCGSAPARSRAIASALDIIEAQRHDAITVCEICQQTEVSWRTMDRAFRERFGMGPKAYLKRRRLVGVRADLLSQLRDGRIVDIANRWDFWHMGQFARDYRALFDELPSETVAR
jgi:AraC family ethanolamine operon transcriptional activator